MQQILSQFQIDTPVGSPRPLRVGIINDSYVVPALRKGDPSYFLQRINHHVFPNVDALQRNIATVTGHIRRKLEAAGCRDIDRRVLRLIPTREGGLYCRTSEGDCWRVYLLIADAASHDTADPASARLAGEAFGDFQTMLSDLPFDQVAESIPNFHNIEHRLRQLRAAAAADAAHRLNSSQDLLKAIEQKADDMCLAERLFREGRLPKRINHCDTKVNNVMFAPDGTVLCIVDLDTVMPGFVLSDFGDFMRTAACTAPEDEPDLAKIHVDMDVFRAYADGYLRHAPFLTPLEKSLLPFGCRLLSYMQAVRFFADYLDGDTYYKTRYPDHNLVRARAQLRLLEEQERAAGQMEAVIARY